MLLTAVTCTVFSQLLLKVAVQLGMLRIGLCIWLERCCGHMSGNMEFSDFSICGHAVIQRIIACDITYICVVKEFEWRHSLELYGRPKSCN